MNRLFEIASELGEIAHKRLILRDEIRKFEISIKTTEVSMIPEGGWPGSNDTQRKAAEATAKLNNKSLIYLRHEMVLDQERLDDLEVNCEILIAECDAWQWTIRDNEVVAAGLMSAFSAMEKYQEHAAYVAMNEPDPQPKISFADMSERDHENAAAVIRLAEMDNIAPECQWELAPVQLSENAKAARQRHEELMQLQDAYEAKYNL